MLLRYRSGRLVGRRRYDYLFTRVGELLPWAKVQMIFTHWLRHTTLTWVDLLIDIQRRTGVAYLFISHDLAVVRRISHRVAVVYRGEIAETGPARPVTSEPQHPYTQRLMLAAPIADPVEQQRRRAARRQLARSLAASGFRACDASA